MQIELNIFGVVLIERYKISSYSIDTVLDATATKI